MPRWLATAPFVVALILLLVISLSLWLVLLFPAWTLVVSLPVSSASDASRPRKVRLGGFSAQNRPDWVSHIARVGSTVGGERVPQNRRFSVVRASATQEGDIMTNVTEQELEDMEALFVQTAASMTSDGRTIKLEGLSPSTLFFSDRPKREVGHMSTRQFVDVWGDGDNSFAQNPPNAVLSFVEPGDRLPEDAVVVIQDPHLDGDVLSYSIELLDGIVPTTTGPCALFIDPFGRPLSPVSAAGMHRRERRRMR